MSYILDALKKAEAERRQEQVPGLHAQPIAPVTENRRGPSWLWPTLGVGTITALAALIAVFWWQPWRAMPTTTPTTTPAMTSAPQASSVPPPASVAQATPAPPAAPAAQATPPAPMPAPTPAPTTAARAAPETTAPKSAAAIAKAPPKAAKPKAKPAPAAPAKDLRDAETAPAVAATNARPLPADESIPALRELPEALQRTIPQVTIGGYIYAAKPADRSVLINKRLVRDGDQVAPGLTLEKMTPTGLVFNYNGTRFRTSY